MPSRPRRHDVLVALGAVLVLVAAVLLLGACSNGRNGHDTTARDAAVYVAALGAVAGPALPASDKGPPVLYVAPSTGNSISAAVQAQVVKGMKDDAEVRFVDQGTDVIDHGVDGAPVKGAALLSTLGPIPRAGPTQVAVGLYRDAADDRRAIVALDGSGTDWRVTAVTPAP